MNDLEKIEDVHASIFFFLTIAVLLLVNFLSFYAGKRFRETSQSFPSDIISNNILGLLALILGFSFSMVINRYEFKRELAIKEANAIETAYLRSKLIKFEKPEQTQTLFKKYVDARIETYESKSQDEVLQELKKAQADLWNDTKKITLKNPGNIEATYVLALNDMFDVGKERTFVLFKMLHAAFYFLIVILASAAVGFIAFDRGFNANEGHWRPILFIVLFSIVFAFIFDMDHFRTGFINVGQDSLLRVREAIL